MAKHNEATWYADYLTRPIWGSDMAGSKPSLENLSVAHAFGKPGKQSLALAMAMRPAGATGSEIQIACGAPQNNHRRGLITEGMLKRIPHPARGNVTVYKVELSDKGRKAVEAAKVKAVAAEAAKGDGKGKPATVKAAKPVKPAKPRKVKAPKPVDSEPVNIQPDSGSMPQAEQVTEAQA